MSHERMQCPWDKDDYRQRTAQMLFDHSCSIPVGTCVSSQLNGPHSNPSFFAKNLVTLHWSLSWKFKRNVLDNLTLDVARVLHTNDKCHRLESSDCWRSTRQVIFRLHYESHSVESSIDILNERQSASIVFSEILASIKIFLESVRAMTDEIRSTVIIPRRFDTSLFTSARGLLFVACWLIISGGYERCYCTRLCWMRASLVVCFMYFHLQHNWQRTKDKNFTRLHSSPSQLDASSEVNVYFDCSALFLLKNSNETGEGRHLIEEPIEWHCVVSSAYLYRQSPANEPRWTITVRFLREGEMKGKRTQVSRQT